MPGQSSPLAGETCSCSLCFLPILAAAVICPPSPVLQYGLALLSRHFPGPGTALSPGREGHTPSVSCPSQPLCQWSQSCSLLPASE